MNLRDLRYLVALAELRHFGRAADACHVSQPTLSTQIKKLEDELGVSLVERAPRHVMLTPAGHDIAARARRVLAEVEQMRETARRTSDPEAGSVRIGFFPTLGPYLLPHVVPRIRARFPRLELLLVEEKTEVVLHLLRDGKLDAAVLALPLHEDWLETEFLFEEPFMLAVPEGHPLAGHRDLRLAELSDQHLLLLEEGHCLRDQALAAFDIEAPRGEDVFAATSLHTLVQMVSSGLGVSFLPEMAVRAGLADDPGVVVRPISADSPRREIVVAWRAGSSRAAEARLLAEALKLD